MKKALCILLCMILLCPVLISCGSSLEPVEEEKETVPKVSTTKKKEEVEKETEEVVPDPDEDEVIKILMIGNSFCYYFPDELYGMLETAGMNIEVYNLYYSGCKLHQHWNWYLENEAKYQFIETSGPSSEKRTILKDYTLKKCLNAEAWDIISIQQHFGPTVANTYDACYNSCNPYGEKLANLIRKMHPKADFYFQETWAYQVGWSRDGVTVENSAMQSLHADNIIAACKQLCLDLQLPMIPCGSAWKLARNHPQIGDVLCNKGPNGDDSKGDRYHEGTTGGGQYLNACVWFETITGQSCIGNTWRPTDYQLDENRAQLLQKIAHQAVAEKPI